MSRKYTILFVSTLVNYFIDDTGSFHRMYQNLIHFHNHKDFKVIVLQSDDRKKEEKKFLKQEIKCYHFKPLKFLGNNFMHFLDFNPFYLVKVIKIINKFKIDLIHIEYPYGINILTKITKIPIIYNAYNVESIYHKITGAYYRKIPPFFRFFYKKYIYLLERSAVKNCALINAFSEDDRNQFLKTYRVKSDKIFVNKMGRINSIFNSPMEQKVARKILDLNTEKFYVIFHGSYYSHYANREAIQIIVEKIAPKIEDNDIIILIAGKVPKFNQRKNLKFLGHVDDLKSFLYSADIAIVPIFRASGIRIKMIDYFSAGIPIISTKQATLGLPFKNNYYGVIVNKKNPIKDFINKINELKNNKNKINYFKKNINHLMTEHYNWDNILNNLEIKYREIID